MQKAILVQRGTDVLEKRIYAGDLTVAQSEMARLQAKFPTLTFTLYADDQDPTFVATVVNAPEQIEPPE